MEIIRAIALTFLWIWAIGGGFGLLLIGLRIYVVNNKEIKK